MENNEQLEQKQDWYFQDNGFSSTEEMNIAQKPIIERAVKELEGKNGPVLDLGCGNGILLKKIYDHNSDLIPYGVEIDPSRFAHIAELLPEFSQNFQQGDIFDTPAMFPDQQFEMAILMPGRFLEVESERATLLREWLKTNVKELLTYVYGEKLYEYPDTESILERTGFTPVSECHQSVCLAKVVE